MTSGLGQVTLRAPQWGYWGITSVSAKLVSHGQAYKRKSRTGVPWGSSGWESALQSRVHGLTRGPGSSHMPWDDWARAPSGLGSTKTEARRAQQPRPSAAKIQEERKSKAGHIREFLPPLSRPAFPAGTCSVLFSSHWKSSTEQTMEAEGWSSLKASLDNYGMPMENSRENRGRVLRRKTVMPPKRLQVGFWLQRHSHHRGWGRMHVHGRLSPPAAHLKLSHTVC